MSYLDSINKNSTNYVLSGLSNVIVNGESVTTLNRTVSITGFNNDSNLAIKVVFTNGARGSSASSKLQINSKNVKVNQNGTLVDLPIHTLTEGGSTVYRFLQSNTCLEVYYNGSNYVVIGNPIVISTDDYTIYADGQKITSVIGDKYYESSLTYYVNNDTSHTFTLFSGSNQKRIVWVQVTFVPYYGDLGIGFFRWGNANNGCVIGESYRSWRTGTSQPLITNTPLDISVEWSTIANNSVVWLHYVYKNLYD